MFDLKGHAVNSGLALNIGRTTPPLKEKNIPPTGLERQIKHENSKERKTKK